MRDVFTLSNQILGNAFLHNSFVAASLPDFLESMPPFKARLSQCQQLSTAHHGFICCQRMSNSRPGLPHPFFSLWPGLQGKMKQISALSLWVQNCKARMAPGTQTLNCMGPQCSPCAPLPTNPPSQPRVTEQKSLQSSPRGTVCTLPFICRAQAFLQHHQYRMEEESLDEALPSISLRGTGDMKKGEPETSSDRRQRNYKVLFFPMG